MTAETRYEYNLILRSMLGDLVFSLLISFCVEVLKFLFNNFKREVVAHPLCSYNYFTSILI